MSSKNQSTKTATASLKTVSGQWLDVCLKNIVIFLAAAEVVGYDPEVIWNALRHLGGESVSWTRKKLAQTWVKLRDYQVVENALVSALGHPAHLVKIGRFSPNISFGFSEALEKRMLKSFIRFITSPRVAMRAVAAATRAYNTNKTFTFVVDESNRCVFEIEYLIGPNGERRVAEQDYYSLLFYIRGILESLAKIWPFQSEIGTVRYCTVNVRPEVIIKREAPDAHVEIKNGLFCIDNVECGRIVHLRRDRATDAFLGEYQDTAGGETIPAILITQDVETACTMTKLMLPILRAGEIYRYNGNEIPNHVELRWRTNLFFQLVERIPGILKPLADGLKSEERTAEAEITAATERAARELFQRVVEEQSPTRAVAHALVNHTYQPKRVPTLALLLDIVGYTQIGQDWGPDEIAKSVISMFEELERTTRDAYGFWPYKRMGDALLAIHADWARFPEEPSRYASMTEAARGMVNCADELHRVADRQGLKLRIGIAYGDVVWSNQAPSDRQAVVFEGLGTALNIAARLECYGATPGKTAVSTAFVQVASGNTGLVTLNEHVKVGPFQYRGEVPEKNHRTIPVWDVLGSWVSTAADSEKDDAVVVQFPTPLSRS